MRHINATLALVAFTAVGAALLAVHPEPVLAQSINQILSGPAAAPAATTPIGIDGNGVHLFDAALTNIKSVTGTGGWLDASIGVANILFKIMLGLMWVVALTRYYLDNHTLEGCGHMFGNLFVKTAPMIIFMSLAPSMLGGLTSFATTLGTEIAPVAAIAGAPTLQNASGIAGPDEILNTGGLLVGSLIGAAAHPFGENGWQMAGKFILGDPALGLNIQTLVMSLVTGAVIMFAFVVFAVEYMLCLIQCYIAVSVGAINLGWMASDYTKNWAEAYIGMCWTSVMRIVLTVSCISLVMGIVVPDLQNISKGVTPENAVMTQYKMMAEAAIAALLAWKVPSYASTLMSGQPAVTAGQVGGITAAGYASGKQGVGNAVAKFKQYANRNRA